MTKKNLKSTENHSVETSAHLAGHQPVQKKAASIPNKLDQKSLASLIDHTALKADVTPEEIQKICREALQYHFATVCVNSVYIKLVADLLKGSSVLPIA